MSKTAFALLLVTVVASSFAAKTVTHKTDMDQLIETIDQRVEKYSVSTGTEEDKDFKSLISAMESDIDVFSQSSKLGFDDVVKALEKVFQARISKFETEVKKTKSSKLANHQMALMALSQVHIEHDTSE